MDTVPVAMKSDLLIPLAIPALLLFAQCSPVAPPLARGSAHFRTKVPLDAEPGTTCTASYGGIGEGTAVPDLPGSGNLNTLGTMVVDGGQSAQANVPYEIECNISGNGDLTFSGKLAGPNSSPFLTTAGSGTNIQVSGTLNGETGTGVGEVHFFTTSTLAVSPKDGTFCEFKASPSPLKACSNNKCLGGETPADYGGFALTFYCPDMNMGAAGIAADCEADGTIVLDRCTY